MKTCTAFSATLLLSAQPTAASLNLGMEPLERRAPSVPATPAPLGTGASSSRGGLLETPPPRAAATHGRSSASSSSAMSYLQTPSIQVSRLSDISTRAPSSFPPTPADAVRPQVLFRGARSNAEMLAEQRAAERAAAGGQVQLQPDRALVDDPVQRGAAPLGPPPKRRPKTVAQKRQDKASQFLSNGGNTDLTWLSKEFQQVNKDALIPQLADSSLQDKFLHPFLVHDYRAMDLVKDDMGDSEDYKQENSYWLSIRNPEQRDQQSGRLLKFDWENDYPTRKDTYDWMNNFLITKLPRAVALVPNGSPVVRQNAMVLRDSATRYYPSWIHFSMDFAGKGWQQYSVVERMLLQNFNLFDKKLHQLSSTSTAGSKSDEPESTNSAVLQSHKRENKEKQMAYLDLPELAPLFFPNHVPEDRADAAGAGGGAGFPDVAVANLAENQFQGLQGKELLQVQFTLFPKTEQQSLDLLRKIENNVDFDYRRLERMCWEMFDNGQVKSNQKNKFLLPIVNMMYAPNSERVSDLLPKKFTGIRVSQKPVSSSVASSRAGERDHHHHAGQQEMVRMERIDYQLSWVIDPDFEADETDPNMANKQGFLLESIQPVVKGQKEFFPASGAKMLSEQGMSIEVADKGKTVKFSIRGNEGLHNDMSMAVKSDTPVKLLGQVHARSLAKRKRIAAPLNFMRFYSFTPMGRKTAVAAGLVEAPVRRGGKELAAASSSGLFRPDYFEEERDGRTEA
ncbi:unnamed protein product [Amoebophrya sp. A120]|nr:unnamed protein product [Amoebophrya sp. A120]|eukprot:GSA120T00009082001.1